MSRHEPDRIEQAQAGKQRGARFYLMVVLLVLAAIFVFQNTEDTEVKFIFAKATLPLFFALLIAVLLGMLIGWLLPKVRGSGGEQRSRE